MLRPNRLSSTGTLFTFLMLSALIITSSAPAYAQGAAAGVHVAQRSETKAPTARGYAALGASETWGVGAAPRSKAYAYRVARALGARPFVNAGISGTTLPGGYQVELSAALAIRPRLVTLFFGYNDLRAGVSRDTFLRHLTRLVTALHRTKAQVLVIGLPDLSLVPAVKSTGLPGVRQIVASWNAGMRRVVRKTGAHFLDLRTYNAELARHPEYISGDGLHPSNAGYARLAQVIVATVKSKGLWSSR